jgi:hypothetical protein
MLVDFLFMYGWHKGRVSHAKCTSDIYHEPVQDHGIQGGRTFWHEYHKSWNL